MKIDSRTAITITASLVIGFVGDVIIYSLSQSKGKKFSIHIPRGGDLAKLLVLGFATGLVLDIAVKQVQVAVMTEEEKKLQKLVAQENELILKGERRGKNPQKVLWA